MSMRAFILDHRNKLLTAGGVLALFGVWLLLGTGSDDRSARGLAAGGTAAAGETDDGYTIDNRSWAGLPSDAPAEPAPYLSPEDERMVKDLQSRLVNMDIAIEGK